jgi:hypothetical protein
MSVDGEIAMNANLNWAKRASLGVLVAVALAGCAASPSAPPPEITQRIEAARTPADHQSLATYYTQEAAKARDKVLEHRRMGASYKTMASVSRDSGMYNHCNSLVKSSEDMAKEYDALAASHRQLAEQAK